MSEFIFNKEVDEYLSTRGFCTYKMNPLFPHKLGYEVLTLDKTVMRQDLCDLEGYITRIFINAHELYIERQCPNKDYDSSRFSKFYKQLSSVQEVEKSIKSLMEIEDMSVIYYEKVCF